MSRRRSPMLGSQGPTAQSYRVKPNGVSLSPGGRRKDTGCQSALHSSVRCGCRKCCDGSLKHATEH